MSSQSEAHFSRRSVVTLLACPVFVGLDLIWDLMLHPNNTKLLFLTLGLPLNQRHCNFEEHFLQVFSVGTLKQFY